MANQNPIHLDEPPVKTEFIIPKEYSNTMIYLTLGIELQGAGWQYASVHTIYLGFQNLYPEKTPEPSDLKLNYGSVLHDQSLTGLSHISRVNPSGNNTGPAPKIKYTLSIEAGDKLIDSFQKESGTNNPSDFKYLIKFTLQQ